MNNDTQNTQHTQNEVGIEKQTYSRSEAARYLGVSVISIDRAAANKKISFFRIGRRVLFGKSHLDDFLFRGEVRARAGRA